MALLNKAQLSNGLSFKEAYYRIDTINGSKEEIKLSVNIYSSQESFIKGYSYLEQYFYTFTPKVSKNSLEMWNQAYEFLKSLEEYKDSIDC